VKERIDAGALHVAVCREVAVGDEKGVRIATLPPAEVGIVGIRIVAGVQHVWIPCGGVEIVYQRRSVRQLHVAVFELEHLRVGQSVVTIR
jgi:hypothetical protein